MELMNLVCVCVCVCVCVWWCVKREGEGEREGGREGGRERQKESMVNVPLHLHEYISLVITYIHPDRQRKRENEREPK